MITDRKVSKLVVFKELTRVKICKIQSFTFFSHFQQKSSNFPKYVPTTYVYT